MHITSVLAAIVLFYLKFCDQPGDRYSQAQTSTSDMQSTVAGVLLNRIFPVWLITLCLIVILTYLTYKTTAKGLRLHYQEQQTKASQTAEAIGLQAVQVDQGLNHSHSDAVHNLLRSISEEPVSPQHSFPAKSSALLPHSSKDQPALSSQAGPPPVSLAEVKLQHLQPMDSLSSVHSGRIATSSSAQGVELLDMAESHSMHQNRNCKHGIQPVEALQLGGARDDNDDVDIVPDDDDIIPFLRQQGSQDSAEGCTAAQAHDRMHLDCAIQQKCLDALHQLPWRKLTTATLLWVVFAGLQLLKATVRVCSTAYWLLYCTQVVAAVSASAFFIRAACQNQNSQPAGGRKQQQVTVAVQSEWTRQVLTMASLVGVGGGAVAGTVGMGGGVVMGPLLLYLQVPPAASAATSTLMILFSSSAATLSFAVDGRVNAQYAFMYGSLNFFASFLGVFLVGRAVKRSGRSSIIVLLLAMMMASGALVSAVFGGIESVRDIRSGQDLAFSSLCA